MLQTINEACGRRGGQYSRYSCKIVRCVLMCSATAVLFLACPCCKASVDNSLSVGDGMDGFAATVCARAR